MIIKDDKYKHLNKQYYSGYYMDIHHFVRSGWEHNIARILQWNQLDYDYECYTFKLSNKSTYTPDFYVYADDTFYEVKGEMHEDSFNRIQLFKKEYPDKKLIIIDKLIYNDLIYLYNNINFNKHVCIYNILYYTYDYKQYRHNNIKYEQWELDYKYYTNQRYNLLINEYYTIKEITTILNIPMQKINTYCNNGLLPFTIINNQYYFPKSDIDIFVKNNYRYFIKAPNDISYKKECRICHKQFITYYLTQHCCSLTCLRKYSGLIKTHQQYYKCINCKKNYKAVYFMDIENIGLCPTCFRKKYNKHFSTNLLHYHWAPGQVHATFINEAEENFSRILEYLNNEYSYQDDIYIDSPKSYYKYQFIRKKNNTLYIIHSACTHTMIRNYKRFLLNNKNINVHIITAKKYKRIITWFIYKHKLNLKINNYIPKLEKKCIICNKTFIGTKCQIYCSTHCKIIGKWQRRHKRKYGY